MFVCYMDSVSDSTKGDGMVTPAHMGGGLKGGNSVLKGGGEKLNPTNENINVLPKTIYVFMISVS